MISPRIVRFLALCFCLFLCPYVPSLAAVVLGTKPSEGNLPAQKSVFVRCMVAQVVAVIGTLCGAAYLSGWGTFNGLVPLSMFESPESSGFPDCWNVTKALVLIVGFVIGSYLLYRSWRLRKDFRSLGRSYSIVGATTVLYGAFVPSFMQTFLGWILDSHLLND